MSSILSPAIPSMAIGGFSFLVGMLSVGGNLQAQHRAANEMAEFRTLEQQRVSQETTKMEADRAIAEAAQRNKVAAPKQLILSDYTKNPQRPQLDWKAIVNPNDCVEIYDRFRSRVGTAYGGVYYPIENAKNLCHEVKQ
jgi:hypothetical protein